MTESARARFAVPLMAGAGLVAGHTIDYVVTFWSGRSQALAATGHGYLRWAVAGAYAAFAASLLIAGITGFRDSYRRAPRATTLILIQVPGFVALEIVERVWSGSPLDTLTPRLLLAGVVLQLLTAFAFARLLRGAVRVGAAIARMRRGRPHRASSVRVPAPVDRPVAPAFFSARRVRAPPLLSI